MKGMLYRIRGLIFLSMFGICLFACTKDRPIIEQQPDPDYGQRLGFLIKDNPSQYTVFYSQLQKQGLSDTLQTKGPFTVLALNYEVLGKYVGDNNFVNIWERDSTKFILKNYIIPGIWPLKAEGIKNGETYIQGPDGFKYFLHVYFKDNDTVFTINGDIVTQSNKRASNGCLHRLYKPLWPWQYQNCLSAIQNRPELVLFAYAIKRAGLEAMLSDPNAQYTVLAPLSFGEKATLDTIAAMSKDSLIRLVKYHIIPGRHFISDYQSQYKGDGSMSDSISVSTLLDGKEIKIALSNNFFPVSKADEKFRNGLYNQSPLFFIGGNKQTKSLAYEDYVDFPYHDILSGSGIVHEIDKALEP